MTTHLQNNVTGVLLAGGLSRRMFADAPDNGNAAGNNRSRDKCLELLDHRPMLAHVIDRIAPQVAALVLNANGDPNRFSSFDLPVITDPIEGFAGPLAGVLAGMRWSQINRPSVNYIATVSTDAPFLPTDLVAKLVASATAHPVGSVIIASANGNRQPVIGLWPVIHADDLQEQLENGIRKVLHWTDRHGTVLCEFDMQKIGSTKIDPFFNANHPEELEEARRLLRLST